MKIKFSLLSLNLLFLLFRVFKVEKYVDIVLLHE